MARKTGKNTGKQKVVILWIIFMAVFIAELLLYAWSRVQCVDAGYEISKATQHQRELITLQNNLKIELASLKSPDRIAKIAQKKLGLVTPTPKQMVVIP
jgi:cell division protein FtsL